VKRLLPVLLFATLLAAVLVGGHAYLVQRLVLDTGLRGATRGLGLAVVLGGALSLLLQPVGERVLRPPLSRVIAWPASLWMGLGFLLIVALGASDALWWALGNSAWAADAGALDAELAARGRALAVVGVGGLAAIVGLRSALRPPRLVRVELRLPRWPRGLDGFRIVQISDVHIGPLLGRRFAEQVVERVNALEPDLVAVTGDLVDGAVRTLTAQVEPFAELRARFGAFFVTGNHDYYSGAESWVERVRELGLRVLRNERVRIRAVGGEFDLAGVEDHHAHFVSEQREDLPRALEGRDPATPVVLLAHDPGTFREAARLGVDLQLSGHTHGGQIWPFVYLVRLAVRWIAGHYREGASQLYVSRGTGFWGPPMRLAAPAEITELVLRPAAP
jgi:hypothetical protein